MINRRNFISGLVIGGAVIPWESAEAEQVSLTSNVQDPFWAAPRVLNLYRPSTGERSVSSYWTNGQLDVEGYIKICNILRDQQANLVVQMDLRLLDLMRAIQGYLSYYGFNKPIIVTSGYRSPKTNSSLENAAKNSQHLRAKALDFVMEGIPSNYIGLLASYYKGGGVGFYPGSGFTHIDTGSVRVWGANSLSRLKIR